MAETSIEWTEKVWNPTTGCDQVSPGCDNCYALTMAKRLKGMGSAKYQRDGDPKTSGPGFGVSMHPGILTEPFRWRKPKRVFVNSMSDLFHKEITDEFIAEVFAVMALCGQHTFQVLTKRHARMRSLLNSEPFWTRVGHRVGERCDAGEGEHPGWGWTAGKSAVDYLSNVWLGCSVEDQHWADIRIPALLDTPAAVRFISAEPLLGPINLSGGGLCNSPWHYTEFGTSCVCGGTISGPEDRCSRSLNWVIVGGESGANARPMHPDWVRSIQRQCEDAGVSFLFKQWGGIRPKSNGRELDGRTWDQYPQ